MKLKMKYENILVYLEKIRVFCFQDGEHLLKVPIEGDWNMRHLDEALREAQDIIYDYSQATEQASRLIEKYETVKDAIQRGNGTFDTWQCPNCQKFISFGNEHCHWCGQRLGWEPKTRPKQGGKGKCRKH